LRELRVVRRREGESVRDAVAARAGTERALGRDVDCVRRERVEGRRELAARQEGEPNLGVGRAEALVNAGIVLIAVLYLLVTSSDLTFCC